MCVGGGEDRDRGIMSVVSWGLSSGGVRYQGCRGSSGGVRYQQ